MTTIEELQKEIAMLKKGAELQQRQIQDQKDEIDFLIKEQANEVARLRVDVTRALSDKNDYMYRLQDLQRDYAELWNLARENGLCGVGSSLTGPQASNLASSMLVDSDSSNISLDSPDTPPETPAVCLRIIAEARKARKEHQAYYNRSKQNYFALNLNSRATPNPLLHAVESRPSAPAPQSPLPVMKRPIATRLPSPRMARRKSLGASESEQEVCN